MTLSYFARSASTISPNSRYGARQGSPRRSGRQYLGATHYFSLLRKRPCLFPCNTLEFFLVFCKHANLVSSHQEVRARKVCPSTRKVMSCIVRWVSFAVWNTSTARTGFSPSSSCHALSGISIMPFFSVRDSTIMVPVSTSQWALVPV